MYMYIPHMHTHVYTLKHNVHTPNTMRTRHTLTHSNTQPHTLHTHTFVHMHICPYTYRSRMARPPQRSLTETCSPRSFAPSLQRPSQTVPALPSCNVITGQKWPHCMKPEMSSPWLVVRMYVLNISSPTTQALLIIEKPLH